MKCSKYYCTFPLVACNAFLLGILPSARVDLGHIGLFEIAVLTRFMVVGGAAHVAVTVRVS